MQRSIEIHITLSTKKRQYTLPFHIFCYVVYTPQGLIFIYGIGDDSGIITIILHWRHNSLESKICSIGSRSAIITSCISSKESQSSSSQYLVRSSDCRSNTHIWSSSQSNNTCQSFDRNIGIYYFISLSINKI